MSCPHGSLFNNSVVEDSTTPRSFTLRVWALEKGKKELNCVYSGQNGAFAWARSSKSRKKE